MPDHSFLDWPFFDEGHRDFARALETWCVAELGEHHGEDVDAATRDLVARLGGGGWLARAVPQAGASAIDVRTLCLAREILARHMGLADFAFAMQGLGTGSVLLHGSPALQDRILPGVRAGTHVAAFALSEPEAGSDVAAMRCAAIRSADGTSWRIDGEKNLDLQWRDR